MGACGWRMGLCGGVGGGGGHEDFLAKLREA